MSPTRDDANPFRYGDVASGDFFTDREHELRELQLDVRSGQNVLILSPRRFGKTSLVTEAIRHLRERKVLVAYVDLLRATNKPELAGFLATALYEGLESPFEQALHRVAEFFGDLPLRPKISLSTGPDGSVTPSFEFGVSATEEDADATLERLFEMPARVAAKRKRRVAMVIDEFQAILDIDDKLPRRMRADFQFQPEVAHVYLGSKQHLLRRVFTDANQPLYNSARIMPLGPIAPERFEPFVRERFDSTGLSIEGQAITRVLEITRGHPHDTQKLCYFAWNLALASGRATVEADVDLALAQVIRTDTARYTEIWESLTPIQRRVLEMVARVGASEDLRSSRARATYGLKSYATTEYALDALLERSLIDRLEPGRFTVSDVFLFHWLRAS
jgi:hypothetical protein